MTDNRVTKGPEKDPLHLQVKSLSAGLDTGRPQNAVDIIKTAVVRVHFQASLTDAVSRFGGQIADK